jgi:hypothetical protein
MNFIDNQYIYGAAYHDLWALQNHIMAHCTDTYQWDSQDFFSIVENPGVIYKTSFTKSELQSMEQKKVIFLTPSLYKNYYHIFKNFQIYIILLDFSIYSYGTLEEVVVLEVDPSMVGYSIDQYCQLNNDTYHQEIIYHSFKTASLDWEYLRKNWEFLHWFMGFWLGEHLIKNHYTEWNYIKSLVMLIEYYPCLYSFFPEKKVLTCNYLHNMVAYCKKY